MVDTIIQAVSPLLGTGAGGADAAAAGATAVAATAAGAAAGAASAGLAVAVEAAGAASAGADVDADVGVCASTAALVASKLSPSARQASSFFISVFSLIRLLDGGRACGLKSFFASLTSTNAHHLLKVVDKHLAVTDLAGAGCSLNGFNNAVYHVV